MTRLEQVLTNMQHEMPWQLNPNTLPYIKEAMEIYARECAKASLEKAASAAKVTINGQTAWGGYIADQESITNPENIVL